MLTRLDQKDLQLYSKHSRKNIILDPFPTVVDPSDPNELALNPKVSYCVVIYSKHCRKNIILDPFPTVVDPSDPVYNYTITYFRV
jgi:hypothetical protein